VFSTLRDANYPTTIPWVYSVQIFMVHGLKLKMIGLMKIII